MRLLNLTIRIPQYPIINEAFHKQLSDEVFLIARIIKNNQGQGPCKVDNILDITQTESNNCFNVINYYFEENNDTPLSGTQFDTPLENHLLNVG